MSTHTWQAPYPQYAVLTHVISLTLINPFLSTGYNSFSPSLASESLWINHAYVINFFTSINLFVVNNFIMQPIQNS